MLSKVRKWASISIGAAIFGNMAGRFFLGAYLLEEFSLGSLEICKTPCRQASLSTGTPAGEHAGSSFAGTFERKEIVYLAFFLGPRGH